MEKNPKNNTYTHTHTYVSVCNAGRVVSIPGLGRSPGGGRGNPLQYSCLENPMDGEAWQAMFHRVAKSWTQLKQLSMHTCIHTHIYTYTLEKEMFTHSSVLIWRISWTVAPGGLYMDTKSWTLLSG